MNKKTLADARRCKGCGRFLSDEQIDKNEGEAYALSIANIFEINAVHALRENPGKYSRFDSIVLTASDWLDTWIYTHRRCYDKICNPPRSPQ